MRVVLDTNIFVGACIGVGACNAVVRASLTQRFTPLMGAALFAEYQAGVWHETPCLQAVVWVAPSAASYWIFFWPDASGRACIFYGAQLAG